MAVRHVPEPYRAFARRGQDVAARVEGHRHQPLRLGHDGQLYGVVGVPGVPQPDRAVPARGGQDPALRGEGDRDHVGGVAGEPARVRRRERAHELVADVAGGCQSVGGQVQLRGERGVVPAYLGRVGGGLACDGHVALADGGVA